MTLFQMLAVKLNNNVEETRSILLYKGMHFTLACSIIAGGVH